LVESLVFTENPLVSQFSATCVYKPKQVKIKRMAYL